MCQQLTDALNDDNSEVRKMIKFHQQVLHMSGNDVMCDKWIEKHYEHVVIYFSMINRYIVQRIGKGFVIAPVSRIKAIFAHIDTEVLYGILKESQVIKSSWSTFNEIRDDQWKSILSYEQYLTKKQRKEVKFTGTIQSDGVAVCIHLRRPKYETVKRDHIKDANDRVLGCDPGRSNLLTMVELDNDGKWTTYKLTRGQYYLESGAFEANRKAKRWQKPIQSALDQLSKQTTKLITVRSFVGYMNVIISNSEVLWVEYLKRRWARQRFAVHSGKTSVINKFLSSLQDESGRRTVIAYGSAKFSSTNKGELAAPTTRLYNACVRHYKTVLVDEFRTTQIHYKTDERLSKVYEDGKEVRGLRWCSSTIGCKFIDRDINAALNMLRCYMCEERPQALRRSEGAQPQAISKHIRCSGTRENVKDRTRRSKTTLSPTLLDIF